MFAISLDLVLGYTGIVSLGHAAFFGMGAYAAALFAKLVMPDPLVADFARHGLSGRSTLRGTWLGYAVANIWCYSLGVLIANGFQYMLSGIDWISFFPGVALLVTIVAINLVGDRLRDVLNPRLER